MVLSDNGYNPMGWDCNKKGCFNKKRRPKIEVFSECFPGRINFGDVDGIVEINGSALMLEWKTSISGSLPKGQQIMYERLTKSGVVSVIVVVGDAETMECSKYCLFFNGSHSRWFSADLNGIKEKIKAWALWARKQQLL